MTCGACGRPVEPVALTCPHCGNYLRLKEVEALITRALGSEQRKDHAGALALWEQLFAILPASSRHRGIVIDRIKKFRLLTAPPAPLLPPSPAPARPAPEATPTRPAPSTPPRAIRPIPSPAPARPPAREPSVPGPVPGVVPAALPPVSAPKKTASPWRLRIALLSLGAVAVIFTLLLVGFRWGPALAVWFIHGGEGDQSRELAAAFKRQDWEAARELLAAAGDEPWAREGKLLGRFLMEDRPLWETLNTEPEPTQLLKILELKSSELWGAQRSAIDSGAAVVLRAHQEKLDLQAGRLRAALVANDLTAVRVHWAELKGGGDYFAAIPGGACPAARTAARRVAVLLEEQAPTVVHALLDKLRTLALETEPPPAAGETALTLVQAALAVQPSEQWLAADKQAARAALAAIAKRWPVVSDPQAAPALTAFLAGATTPVVYEDLVAEPPKAGRDAVIDWNCELVACEPAGERPFTYNAGGSEVAGNYRLVVRVINPQAAVPRTALAVVNGFIPAALAASPRLRVVGTAAGMSDWTDPQHVVQRVPVILARFLAAPDGTVIQTGGGNPAAPGAQAELLLGRLR